MSKNTNWEHGKDWDYKKDGKGKFWNGGHETSRKDGDIYRIYRHDPEGSPPKGWSYDYSTGEFKIIGK